MKAKERETLIATLNERFEKNIVRHPELDWQDVVSRIKDNPKILKSLDAMEASGGEPDVIRIAMGAPRLVFMDCSAESPTGRRSLCFDGAALRSRKENKPKGSAMEMAHSMGIELLTEEQYRHLQTLGEFDGKTSSWILTPPDVRTLGGALFCDRRYGKVFTYHNGAESYYAARGFRGILNIESTS